MDAAYLKSNVNEALIEALTSMAVGLPEDKVEYIGRYLIEYVKRKSAQTQIAEESKEAFSKYAAFESENDIKKTVESAKASEEQAKVNKLSDFLSNLSKLSTSKQDAMNSVTAFLAEYLGVQGTYMAIKKPVGESEALHYYSASPGQEFMIGKKLWKPAEDGDEIAPRQGVSFDAFKIPEVPEEEPVEGEEGQPPKPAPKAQPLCIENCMRDRRIKFYGIPMLGSYLAVPLCAQSLDHIEGCTMGMSEPAPADPENPDAPVEAPVTTFTPLKQPMWMMIGIDTIGEYRTFTKKEIDISVLVGEELVKTLELIEAKMFETQVAFLESHKLLAEPIAAMLPILATEETTALETVALQLAPPAVDPDAPPADPPVEPEAIPESLKPYEETSAVSKIWSSTAVGINGEVFINALLSMQNHVLPAPVTVCNFLYTLGLFLGVKPEFMKDACGDLTWEMIRVVRILYPDHPTVF